MAGDIHNYTVFSGLSIPSVGTIVNRGTQIVSTVSVPAGGTDTRSTGTLTLGATILSIRTIGNLASLASIAATNADNGLMAIWQGASGLSLVLRSGNTIYTIGASAVSAAAP